MAHRRFSPIKGLPNIGDYQRAILSTRGLVSYWPMDGHFRDIKGTNHGTANGGVTFGGSLVAAGAGSFDGVDDYAQMSSFMNGYTQFTFEHWFKMDAVSGGGYSMGHNSFNDWNGPILYILPTYVRLTVYNASNNYDNYFKTVSVSANVGHHMAANWGNDHIAHIYIDGLEITGLTYDPSAIPPTSVNTAAPFTIGQVRNVPNNYTWFKGLIDEVAVYNTVLSAEEIYEHYAILQPRKKYWVMPAITAISKYYYQQLINRRAA